jgi:hypothetical protein
MQVERYETVPGCRIYCGGDVHHGIKQDEFDEYVAMLQRCADDPLGVYLGMGDYTEFRESGHKFREESNTTLEIQEQVDELLEAWELVKDKTVGILNGNHEESLTRRMGYNPYKTWCKQNEVPYLGLMARLEFELPDGKVYDVVATHGHGGGKLGGRVNATLDFLSNHYADLLLMGHNHQLQSFVHTQLTMGEDRQQRRLYKKAGFCGSFMDGYKDGATSYAEVGMKSPLPIGYKIVTVTAGGLAQEDIYL